MYTTLYNVDYSCSEHLYPPSLLKNSHEFGKLYVYYNDRICPLQTLAKEFTTKLYGNPITRD